MKQLPRFLLISILLFSCSKKVKYIDKEAKINIVPLPKSLNLIDPGKHILLSKKIKVFINFKDNKNLYNLISNDFKKLCYSNSFELVTNKSMSNLSLEIDKELDDEGMKLEFTIEIIIKGGSLNALKMARSTLLQLSVNDKEE